MLRRIGRHLVVALLLVAPVWSALAQEPSVPTLRVATRVVPPLVVDQSGVLSGFSIDLWNSIADRLKGKTNYRIAEDIGALLEIGNKSPPLKRTACGRRWNVARSISFPEL